MRRMLYLLILTGMILVMFGANQVEAQRAEPNQKRKLTVTARHPAEFSYDVRLYPDAQQRFRGNAATIFLRYAWELNSEYWKQIGDARLKKWADMPLEKFDRKKHAITIRYDVLKRAAYANHADWNRDIFDNPRLEDVLLPDVQQARSITYALALNIRADLAENKLDDAIEKLRVGFSLIQHLQQSPFFVVKLVAVANTNVLLDQLEDLIQHPDCPNLYWALHQLPNPFITGGDCIDFENAIFLDVRNPPANTTPARWKFLSERIDDVFEGGTLRDSNDQVLDRAARIAIARRGLESLNKFTAAQVQGMGDDEARVHWFAENFFKWNDRFYRWMNVPPSIALSRINKVQTDLAIQQQAFPGMDRGVVGFRKVYLKLWDTQRRIEALKTVEAVRAQVLTLDDESLDQLNGQLNTSLSTPVTIDPMTGKVLQCQIGENGTVLIKSEIVRSVQKNTELNTRRLYELHFRK